MARLAEDEALQAIHPCLQLGWAWTILDEDRQVARTPLRLFDPNTLPTREDREVVQKALELLAKADSTKAYRAWVLQSSGQNLYYLSVNPATTSQKVLTFDLAPLRHAAFQKTKRKEEEAKVKRFLLAGLVLGLGYLVGRRWYRRRW